MPQRKQPRPTLSDAEREQQQREQHLRACRAVKQEVSKAAERRRRPCDEIPFDAADRQLYGID